MISIVFGRHWMSVVACVILSGAVSNTRGMCDDLSPILKIWEARQSRSTGVLVEWEEQHEDTDLDWLRVHRKDPEVKALIEQQGRSGLLAKVPTIKFQQHKRLQITESLYRYSFKGDKTINGVVRPQELDIAMDGSKRVDYSAAYKVDGHPSANVYEASKQLVPNTSYLPIVLVARPFDRRFGGLSRGEVAFIAPRESLDGREYTVIESREPGATEFTTIWLDPVLDYSPIRVSRFSGMDLVFQLDIQYDRDASTIRPSGWRSLSYNLGGVGKSVVVANVLKWNLDETLSLSDFQIKFPVGTTVSEFVGGAERNYIVQGPENEREVLRREMSLPHQVLMNTPTGGTSPTSYALVIVLATIILILIGVMVYRFRFA